MKHKTFFVLFILSSFVCNVSCAAKWRAEHVILIGLDGWGAYSVPKADMPNVKKLMDAGSYTLENRCVLPSSSAVNWASMFMGAGPELHGFTEWGSQKPDLPSPIGRNCPVYCQIGQSCRKNRSLLCHKRRLFGQSGKKSLKTQKKCVQTQNFLIQYVVLRPGVNLKPWNWLANVME